MQLVKLSVSDHSCDFTGFNYYSNLIAKFSNQIANRIALFQNKNLPSYISNRIAKMLISRFKSQSRSGFAHHCWEVIAMKNEYTGEEQLTSRFNEFSVFFVLHQQQYEQ